MSNSTESTNAYVTLLTRPSYLAGALLLAYTLTKHSPSTPLIVTYTPETLPETFIQAFRDEAKHSNIILHAVDHLRLPEDGTEHGMVAERFIDTWSKLRVFDLYDLRDTNGKPFERLCWLDADMMIFSDPSPWIFTTANDEYLNSGDGMNLMAVHTCVCNLDHDAWAPKEWNPENCALTPLASPDQNATVKAEPYTLSNFNSGTFLWRNSKAMSEFVQRRFKEVGNADLRKMKFPDQDFLNEAFDGRWQTLNWRTNALKTWRYWHPNVWQNDNDVAVLHYIVDKPWAARVNPDGTAGYLNKDGETHKWWWDEYFRWESQRKEQGEQELLKVVGKYVAGEAGEVDEEMARSVGGGAQGFAKKWEGKKEEDGGQPESFGQGPSGPILRKPVLGERGHGPVVNKCGPGANGGWSVMDA